ERQARVAVEVLHEPAGEPRVGGEFGRVHAVADDLRIVDLGRQVADPAAHQVEQYPARGQDRPVKGGQRGNRAVVDVADKARRLIEYFVVFGVQFLKGTGRQPERTRGISVLVLSMMAINRRSGHHGPRWPIPRTLRTPPRYVRGGVCFVRNSLTRALAEVRAAPDFHSGMNSQFGISFESSSE